MANKLFSFFKQGSNTYEVKDAQSRADITQLNSDLANKIDKPDKYVVPAQSTVQSILAMIAGNVDFTKVTPNSYITRETSNGIEVYKVERIRPSLDLTYRMGLGGNNFDREWYLGISKSGTNSAFLCQMLTTGNQFSSWLDVDTTVETWTFYY